MQEARADCWGQRNTLWMLTALHKLSCWSAPLFSVSVSSTPWNFYFCKLIQPCLPDKRGFKLNCLFVCFLRRRKEVARKALHADTIKHRREKQNLSSNRWHLNKCWTRQFINMLILCFPGCLSLRFLTWWTSDCLFFSLETPLKPIRGTCHVYS